MIDRRNTLAGLMGTAFAATAARPSFANAPANLGGRSNYKLAAAQSACGFLERLSVTIDVTQDIVCKNTNAANGFNFQLNCYSNDARSAWQQYVVGLLGTDLHAKVDNFRSVDPNKPMKTLVRQEFPLATLQNLTMPAGCKILISLIYGANGVTGAQFTVSRGGRDLGEKRMLLSDLGVTPAQIAPIVAAELVLVGPAGGHTAVLTSGGGTFSYASSVPLTAGASFPACIAHKNGTAETSNSTYGRIAPNPGESFTQTFGVS